jgi:hypothetical protein
MPSIKKGLSGKSTIINYSLVNPQGSGQLTSFARFLELDNILSPEAASFFDFIPAINHSYFENVSMG